MSEEVCFQLWQTNIQTSQIKTVDILSSMGERQFGSVWKVSWLLWDPQHQHFYNCFSIKRHIKEVQLNFGFVSWSVLWWSQQYAGKEVWHSCANQKFGTSCKLHTLSCTLLVLVSQRRYQVCQDFTRRYGSFRGNYRSYKYSPKRENLLGQLKT